MSPISSASSRSLIAHRLLCVLGMQDWDANGVHKTVSHSPSAPAPRIAPREILPAGKVFLLIHVMSAGRSLMEHVGRVVVVISSSSPLFLKGFPSSLSLLVTEAWLSSALRCVLNPSNIVSATSGLCTCCVGLFAT